MMWKHFLIRASRDGAAEGRDVYQGHLDLDLDVPAQEGVPWNVRHLKKGGGATPKCDNREVWMNEEDNERRES